MSQQYQLFKLPETESDTHTFKPLRHPLWTENKAKLIARYLYYFVLITKHGTYIDGFAGPQEPDLPDSWAAKLVLESEPRWLRSFFLCDKDPQRFKDLVALKSAQPAIRNRAIEVFPGDFNEVVREIVASDQVGDRVATFCLLDQRTFECEWKTLLTLASKKSAHKVELFYFLPTGWLDRAISGLKNTAIVERWWGRSDWKILSDMKAHERADAFCKRFRHELNYRSAHAWPIFERGPVGRIMYHMVHATDHSEAPYLMSRAYRKATGAREPLEQLEFEFKQWQVNREG